MGWMRVDFSPRTRGGTRGVNRGDRDQGTGFRDLSGGSGLAESGWLKALSRQLADNGGIGSGGRRRCMMRFRWMGGAREMVAVFFLAWLGVETTPAQGP